MKKLSISIACLLGLTAPAKSFAQDIFKDFKPFFETPLNYVVKYAPAAPKIDGNINDAAWQQATWTSEFKDIEGDARPKPTYPTKVKMLWDDQYLYIAAELQDPHVWGTLKKRDEVIYHDNDFEVFIDPLNTTHEYFEIEVNDLNTIFDLFLNKSYRNGGNPLVAWDAPGLISAVKVQGTLNNPADKDKGWTVEMAIPFKAFTFDRYTTPKEGTLWRINFSRVEWDTKVENGKYVKLKDSLGHPLPEHNWVWSPQNIINMHYPERWGYLQFTKQSAAPQFVLPYTEEQKKLLWLVYYKQKKYFEQHKQYAASLNELSVPEKALVAGKDNQLKLEATGHQFMAFVNDGNQYWSINQDGLIEHAK